MQAKPIIISAICCLITACAVTPEKLRLNNNQWQQYSPEQQQTALTNYSYIKQYFNKDDTTPPTSTIKVTIKHGTLAPPPLITGFKYKPISFTIAHNSCRKIYIKSIKLRPTTQLIACYLKQQLTLDPDFLNANKRTGTIRIYTNPLWLQGFSYKKVTSSGYAGLNQVTITIKKLRK